jgi:hypothetical protein
MRALNCPGPVGEEPDRGFFSDRARWSISCVMKALGSLCALSNRVVRAGE